MKILQNAKMPIKHISYNEAKRQTARTQARQKKLHNQVKELKKKQKLEDAKNQAADLAVNQLMHNKGDFEKILHDINNAAKNQKKDKFDQKYSLAICNEIYADKACLDNLPSTKDDFASIRGTINMMGIEH